MTSVTKFTIIRVLGTWCIQSGLECYSGSVNNFANREVRLNGKTNKRNDPAFRIDQQVLI